MTQQEKDVREIQDDLEIDTLEIDDEVVVDEGMTRGKVVNIAEDGSVDVQVGYAHQGPVIDSYDRSCVEKIVREERE